jgi:hypothetical protein
MFKKVLEIIDQGLNLFLADSSKAIKLFKEYMQRCNVDQCLVCRLIAKSELFRRIGEYK